MQPPRGGGNAATAGLQTATMPQNLMQEQSGISGPNETTKTKSELQRGNPQVRIRSSQLTHCSCKELGLGLCRVFNRTAVIHRLRVHLK